MNQHLGNLDTRFDSATVISLDERGLIVVPGDKLPVAKISRDELTDRAAGAFAAAAIGSAMGAPLEWLDPAEISERFGWVTDFTDYRRRGGPRWTSDVDLLLFAAEAITNRGIYSAEALAARLANLRARRLRLPGEALVAAADRAAQGLPWFEIGVGSYGDGCLLRGVASGLRYPNKVFKRCVSANLNAVVTHATKEAAHTTVAVANVIAAIIAQPKGQLDPGVFRDAVVNSITNSQLATVIDSAIVSASAENRIGRGGSDRRRRLRNAPISGPTAEEALVAALWHFVANPNSAPDAIESAVNAGGDTDTVAALAGAFAGSCHGLAAIPTQLLGQLSGGDKVIATARKLTSKGAAPIQKGRAVAGKNNTNPCHITFLIDRSGSMEPLHTAVIDGFNELIEEQKSSTGEATLTLAAFDSENPFEVVVEEAALDGVRKLGYGDLEARAMTPLYDAIYSTIAKADERLAMVGETGNAEEDQLVVIFTDGLENASRRHGRDEVMTLISDRKDAGWTFVFLGANQDSYAVGDDLGVAHGNVSNYDYSPDGMRLAARSVSRSVRSYRGKGREDRLLDRDRFFEGIKEAERSR